MRQTVNGADLRRLIISAAAAIEIHKQALNDLNVFPVPDGDTGTNMSMTIGAARRELMVMSDDATVSEVADRAASAMLRGARGNSGVILSQFFAGMTKGFSKYQKADAAAVGEAMQEGVKQAYASVITPTEGTILTVAREAVAYAVSRITETSTITGLFSELFCNSFWRWRMAVL